MRPGIQLQQTLSHPNPNTPRHAHHPHDALAHDNVITSRNNKTKNAIAKMQKLQKKTKRSVIPKSSAGSMEILQGETIASMSVIMINKNARKSAYFQ